MKNLLLISTLFYLSGLFVFNANAIIPLKNEIQKAQETSYFGINGGKAIHIPNELETTVKKRIGWMKELGIMCDRSDLWWHLVEPSKGNFDFSVTDKIIKFYEANNIQIYPILCYGAKWWKDHNAPMNDAEIDEYADYVYNIVKKYKEHFTYWSIWNEPNIATFWNPNPDAEMYAKLLKKAYTAAKKADPDCKICAPVIAPLGQWDKKFVERLYQLGCKDYFDIFDYHYYRHTPPETEVPNEINEIKALMNRYNDNKPIWISETGVSSPIVEKPKSYEHQASLIVRNHLICYALGVKKIFYFDLQNWVDSPDASWDSYLGLIEASDEKKPSFQAYKTMIKEIDQKEVIGRINPFENNLEAVLIHDKKNNDYSIAVWSVDDKNEETISLNCLNNKDIIIVDIYGDEEIIPAKTNSPEKSNLTRTISIKVNKFPKYIHSISPNPYLMYAGVKPEISKIEMAPGDKRSLRIISTPLINSADIIINDIKLPDGFKYNKQDGMLEVSENVKSGKNNIKFLIEVKPKEQSDSVSATNLVLSAEVDIIPMFALGLRPYIDNNKLNIDAVISNYSSKNKYEKLILTESIKKESKTIIKKENISIKAGEVKHVDIPVDENIVMNYKEPVNWFLEYENVQSQLFRIYTANFSDVPPVIDGELEEWKSIPYLEINQKEMITRNPEGWSTENASAKAKLWITPDSVNLGVRVYDNDAIINKNKAVEIWKGDSLELYLGFNGPVKRTVIDKKIEFQIGLAPTYEGNKPIIFLFHEDRILDKAKIAVVKLEDGYKLEASILLSELGNPKIQKDMFIGFDIALDDLDTNDWAPQDNLPGRALMWGGNNMNWIDPSGWSMAILKKF